MSTTPQRDHRLSRTPRTGSIHRLTPAGLLDIGNRRVTQHTGHTVEVVQPGQGCPWNGTMGMAYADCVTCAAAAGHRVFIGLVNVSSLDCPRPVARLDELKVTSEARDRIRAAIVNSGEEWPTQITMSLPARLPERSSADLAIAVSVLAANGAVPAAAFGRGGVLRRTRPGRVPAAGARRAACHHRSGRGRY